MSDSDRGAYRLGADIGGTFTDLVLIAPDGRYRTRKVASTVDDYSIAIAHGVSEILAELGEPGSAVSEVVHGTTVAANAILEGKGAKTALVTTRGFRDVLELRRLRIPELFGLDYRPPEPLVARRLRMEVNERLGANGEVITPLDESTLDPALVRIGEEEVEAVAVCLLHSYRNGEHEQRVAELIRQKFPGLYVCTSVDVLPEIREYERTSTTVINAYVAPLLTRYVRTLDQRLEESGVTAPLRMMQSNGGVMSAAAAMETPARIIESGPAAGVVGAHRLAQRMGLSNVITFDMGGTTAKASMIEAGERAVTTEYEVGAGISLASRLVKGRGHALKLPVIDIAEVGAGGGSIVRVDRGGALKVGPDSAGASPGPACYAAGGTEPTVTDANVVLGYISPIALAGGSVEVHPDLASDALRRAVAEPLGMSDADAAYGVYSIANVSMIRAIKAVSTYRGRDPRDFTLLAFGGSGPIHAVEIARSMGIQTVIIPPSPGLFSAIGLLEAEPEYHFVQTLIAQTSAIDPSDLNDAYAALGERAVAALQADGADPSDAEWIRLADLRYSGQRYELTVETPTGSLQESSVVDEIAARFHREHEKTYGHMSEGETVEIVNLRYTVRLGTGSPPPVWTPRPQHGRREERAAYFGPGGGGTSTPVIGREELSEMPREGPMILEEYDATTVVPPGASARLDERANVIIETGLE